MKANALKALRAHSLLAIMLMDFRELLSLVSFAKFLRYGGER